MNRIFTIPYIFLKDGKSPRASTITIVTKFKAPNFHIVVSSGQTNSRHTGLVEKVDIEEPVLQRYYKKEVAQNLLDLKFPNFK